MKLLYHMFLQTFYPLHELLAFMTDLCIVFKYVMSVSLCHISCRWIIYLMCVQK